MTGNEVYLRALALLPARPGDHEGWDEAACARLNLSLAEVLPTENALRRLTGQPELAAMPPVENMEAPLPCAERICCALPFAMAAFLWMDEREEYRAQDMRGRFITLLREAVAVRPEEVKNLYA